MKEGIRQFGRAWPAVALVFAALAGGALASDLAISEFMAANDSVLQDEDGDYPDWIEIHNTSSSAVSLDGWHLTDSDGDPSKWTFPATQIAAQAYMVVFASDKDRATAGSELHTNFKLDAGGEYLALVHPDGVAVADEYSPEYPPQQADISYGIGTSGELRFFAVPTPGLPNDAGFLTLSEPEFSPERGFYSNAFSVTLSCATAGAEIYYTTSCSEPTTNDFLYTGPISIDGTTCIRAWAFKEGDYLPSVAVTHTYLFPAQVADQTSTPPDYPDTWGVFVIGPNTGLPVPADYDVWPQAVTEHAATLVDDLKSLPTLSIVMDVQEMFGSNGLYCVPFPDESNREHAASLEWIDPESQQEFSLNAGMRIFGGGVRVESSKLTFALRFRREYGPSKLEFPLFEHYQMDSEVESVDEFETLALRGIHGDAWQHSTAQYIRDSFVRYTQLAMGMPGVHGRWLHLYINGLYWGIYNVTERPDGDYAASYFGGSKEDYDAIKHPSKTLEPPTTEYEVIDGDSSAWQSALSLAASGLSGSQAYEQFKGLVDVENLADYILYNHYVVNNDWPVQNWYANRRREPGAGFRFYAWDTEYTLGRNNSAGELQMTKLDVNSPGTPAFLYNAAKQNAEFRVLFGDRVHKHMFNNGALTVQRNIARSEALAARVDGGIRAESVRWGDCNRSSNPYFNPFTYSGVWLPEKANIINTWLPQRHAIALSHLVSAGLYPGVAAPVFHVDGEYQHGGTFTNGAMLSMTGGTIYYTLDGSDPRSGGTLYTGPIPLEYSVRVKARVSGGGWSALNEALYVSAAPADLRITELMYHPPGTFSSFMRWVEITNPRDPRYPGYWEEVELPPVESSEYEFVELQNRGDETIGLAGLEFTDGITFDFEAGNVHTLDPGEYVVIVKNLEVFTNRYPDWHSMNIAGEFQRANYDPVQTLADNGERIVLRDGLGRVPASFTYGDGRLWPRSADGAGHSLVPLVLDDQADGRLDYRENWRASAYIGGSPGAADPEPAASVLINEVGAHTDTGLDPPYDSDDWIELYNPLGTAVDVGGWYLSDDAGDLKRYRVPEGTTIAAGGYLLLTENLDFHTNRLDGSGFGLDKAGESVFLSYLPGTGGDRVVDAVRFKGQENGVSLGRYPDGGEYWYGLSPTPDAPNAPPGTHVYISEIMYNPLRAGTNAPNNTRDEYIKIRNPLGTAVELWTDAGAWRIDGGVSYTFPESTTMGAGESLYLVSFDPNDAAERDTFLAVYGLSNGQFRLYGPYGGVLANEGERVGLERPQAPDLPGDGVSWVIVDEADYFGGAPWPVDPDGVGRAIERVDALGSGNDPDNWAAPEPSLLMALHWKLDETSGTVAQDSGWYGRHGTLRDVLPANGDGSTPPARAAGKMGGALEFDGVDDVVRFDGKVVQGFPFTLTAWVRTSSGTGIRCAAYVGESGWNYRYYCIGVNGGKGEIAGHVSNNPRSSRLSAVGSMDIADGAWHHLAGVFRSPTEKVLYVDGVPAAVLTSTLVYTGSVDRFSIGLCDRPAADLAWDGRIDDVRVYGIEVPEDTIHFLAEEVPGTADEDGDGLPDAWERQYFGSTNAVNGGSLDDWDLDGLNNEGEYAAGTDPTNALSAFRVLIGASNGLPVVWFTTLEAAGEGYEGLERYYDIERRTNLLEGGWTGLVPYVDILGSGVPVVFTNEAPSGRAFYRGKVRLQTGEP